MGDGAEGAQPLLKTAVAVFILSAGAAGCAREQPEVVSVVRADARPRRSHLAFGAFGVRPVFLVGVPKGGGLKTVGAEHREFTHVLFVDFRSPGIVAVRRPR